MRNRFSARGQNLAIDLSKDVFPDPKMDLSKAANGSPMPECTS
jgi:hypothetical protein